jgi:hypothetical protein
LSYSVEDDDHDGDAANAVQVTINPPMPANGLSAGQSVGIEVAYQWQVDTDGDLDSATLRLWANEDHCSPPVEYDIEISGPAPVPPCDFQLHPATTLDLGVVGIGGASAVPFEIQNLGSNECLVNAIQVAAGSSPFFSLPDYPATSTNSTTILGGSSLPVMVRFAPTAAGPSTGAISFTISDPPNPHQSINLTGTGR